MDLWQKIFTLSNMLIVFGFSLSIGGYLLGHSYKKVNRFPPKVILNIAIFLICVGVIILFLGYVL